ncbi:hypothetical protein EON67_09340, partial [archaeon]
MSDPAKLLMRGAHVQYLQQLFVNPLSASFMALDASRVWLLFWSVHALSLLDKPPMEHASRIVGVLRECQCVPHVPAGDCVANAARAHVVAVPGLAGSEMGDAPARADCQSLASTGGFGGGPMQSAHTISTYAAVSTLLSLGTAEAYACIDRDALYAFFLSVKDVSGAFRVQQDGEIDTRSCYAVLAVASLCGMLTPELTAGTADFLLRCQTYEGGFAGEPGAEAHGGYTFCAVAALRILDALPASGTEPANQHAAAHPKYATPRQ